MKALLDEFLNYLSVERGLSKNTISSYRTDLIHFIGYLDKKGMGAIEAVKRQDITNYLLSLKDRVRNKKAVQHLFFLMIRQ